MFSFNFDKSPLEIFLFIVGIGVLIALKIYARKKRKEWDKK